MEGDDRFAKFATDPKFRSVSRKDKKVKIDKRFQSMFTDKRFSNKVGVDKRGRPEDFSSKETYQKFYRLKGDKGKKKNEKEDNQESSDSCSSEDDDVEEGNDSLEAHDQNNKQVHTTTLRFRPEFFIRPFSANRVSGFAEALSFSSRILSILFRVFKKSLQFLCTYRAIYA